MRVLAKKSVPSRSLPRHRKFVVWDEEKRRERANPLAEASATGMRKPLVRADDTAHPFSIRLLGSFEMAVCGQLLPPLRFRKSQALLVLLALRQGREVERDWLFGLLWPQ